MLKYCCIMGVCWLKTFTPGFVAGCVEILRGSMTVMRLVYQTSAWDLVNIFVDNDVLSKRISQPDLNAIGSGFGVYNKSKTAFLLGDITIIGQMRSVLMVVLHANRLYIDHNMCGEVCTPTMS